MPPLVDKLKVLHDAVGEEYNLGSLDEFRQKMSLPEKRKAFFDAVGEQYNLGDFKDFDQKITSSYMPPTAPPKETPKELPTTFESLLKDKPVAPLKAAPIEAPIIKTPEDAQTQKAIIIPPAETFQQKEFARIKGEFKATQERELRYNLGIDQRPMTALEMAGSAAGAFNKTVIEAITAIPKLGGFMKKGLDEILKKGDSNPIQSYDAYKFGDWLDKKALEVGVTATDPRSAGSFALQTIPSALGSVAVIVASGGTSGGSAAMGEQLVNTATKEIALTAATKDALKDIGGHMISRSGAMSANMMGMGEFQKAKAAGASDAEAFKVYFANAGIGATEAIPIERALSRINEISGGKVVEILKAGTVGSLEEGAQEGFQQYLTNKVAAGTYDPKREPWTDMIESVGAGMFVGFILPGVMKATQLMEPDQRDATMKAVNEALKNKKVSDDLRAKQKAGFENKVKAPEGPLGKKPSAKKGKGKKAATEAAASPAPETVAPPTNGFVQGEVAISEHPIMTDKDPEGNTIQMYNTGLKDNNSVPITMDVITTPDGVVTYQALNGGIIGNSKEDVVEQIVKAANPAAAPAVQPTVEVEKKEGQATTEKSEVKTATGKEVTTKTTTEKGEKVTKKVTTPTGTKTTTVVTPSAEVLTEKKAAEAAKKTPAKTKAAKSKGGKVTTTKTVQPKTGVTETVKTEQVKPAKPVTPAIVRAAAQEAGIDYDSQEFKFLSEKTVGKQHLDDMTNEELVKMKEFVEFVKTSNQQSNAIQEPSPKEVHVQPAPVNSEAVVEGIPQPEKPTQESGTQAVSKKETAKKEVAKKIDYTNVPKVQQRVVKNNEVSGWTVVSKKNLASSDKTKIYPVIEMKNGEKTIFINTKGDTFNNISDALAKSEGRPEVKKGKKKPVKKATPAKATEVKVEPKAVAEAPVQETPAPAAKPRPAKEVVATAKTLNAVTDESQDILDYLSTDIFPETVDDFIDAISDIPEYAGSKGSAKARARFDQMVSEGLIRVDGKNIYPSFEKQGNEYAPQAVDEYTPEPLDNVVAANKRRSTPIGIVGAIHGPKWLTEFDLGQFIKKGKNWISRNLTNQGVLPKVAFDAWNQSKIDLRKYEAAAIRTVDKLVTQTKKDYDKPLTDAQVIELNLALEGKTTAPNGKPLVIPRGTLRVINDMRNQIDNLTRRFVRDGVVEGDVAAKFMSNLGVYLHRSYEKFDNPLWAEEVGQDSYNRAMDFLKLKYPTYDKIQLKGLIDYLLYSPDAPMSIMKGGTFGSMDLSVLKKRKGDDVLAPEIRALMGEYADPVVNFTRSIGKMSQLVSKNLFQQDVVKAGMAEQIQPGENYADWFNRQVEDGKFLFPEAAGEFIAKIDATGVPSPIDGLYTTPDIAEVLSKFNGYASKDGPFMDFWIKAVSSVNLGLTVLNPGTHFRNFLANPFFALANGHIGNVAASTPTKNMTEQELQAAEKKRKDFRTAEDKLMKLRVQIMSDLSQQLKQKGKIDEKQKEVVRLTKNLARAEKALADARAAGKDVDVLADKQTRVTIAKRKVQTATRVTKRFQNILDGTFNYKDLTDARSELRSLIADPAATQAQKDAVRAKINRLTKLKDQTEKFRDMKTRQTDQTQLEADVDKLRETSSETDSMESLLGTSTWEQKMEKWSAYGLIDDSVSGGMMRDFLRDIKKDPLITESLFSSGIAGVPGKLAGKSKEIAERMYKAGDWIWKVRAFELETKRYQQAYPNKTLKEVEEIAAENVKNIYPTYSRVVPLVKAMKRIPVLGSFSSFPAEVVRTFANTSVLAVKEIRSGNPVLRKAGISRIVGMSTALTIPTALSLMTRALVGMDDEDEKALRAHLPAWSKNSTLIFLDKKGQSAPYLTTLYRYMDMGAFDPYAMLKKPFIAMFFQNKPFDESFLDAMTQAIEPFVSTPVLTAKVDDVINNQAPNGDLIALDTDTFGGALKKRAIYLSSAVAPGFIKVGDRLYKAEKGLSSKQGKQYKIADEMLAAFGFRITTFDPTVSAEVYSTSEINKDLVQISKDAYEVARQPNATPEERKAAFDEYIRGNRRALVLAQRKYESAVRLGADPAVMGRIQWPRVMQGYWWDEP